MRTWHAYGDSKHKCSRRHHLAPSPYWIIHCGHPTAHYPWYIEHADGGDFLGTFRLLAEAKAMAEQLAAGTIVVEGGFYVDT